MLKSIKAVYEDGKLVFHNGEDAPKEGADPTTEIPPWNLEREVSGKLRHR